MALKTIKDPTFNRPVAIDTPALQGTLNVVFRARRQKYLEELTTKAREAGTYPESLLVDVTKSWDLNIDGEDIGCDKAGMQQLLDWPGAGPAMLKEYYEGLWQAASGNSERPQSG